MSAGARPVRAPRGTEISCKGWQQEAALRMLMNNLDPEVAEMIGESARERVGRRLERLGEDRLPHDGLPAGERGAERVLDTPLSETGIVGTAIGMALYGMRPVSEIQFGDFIYPGEMDISWTHLGDVSGLFKLLPHLRSLRLPNLRLVFGDMADATLLASQRAVPRALRGERASNVEYGLRRKDSGELDVVEHALGVPRGRALHDPRLVRRILRQRAGR